MKDEDITAVDIRHKGKNITSTNNLIIKEVRNEAVAQFTVHLSSPEK